MSLGLFMFYNPGLSLDDLVLDFEIVPEVHYIHV